MIDAIARGTLNTKTPNVVKELFKEMAMNNYQCIILELSLAS